MNKPVLSLAVAATALLVAGAAPAAATRTAVFAGGCFWSMEKAFEHMPGVTAAVSGYAGGTRANPTYEIVETGETGYAETLNILYDANVISYTDLLKVLLTVRNPTTLNRQGPDAGPQYRSIIFYHNPAQHKAAQDAIAQFTQDKVWPDQIVTEVQPFKKFYNAEAYHINYYNLHPNQGYCANVIAPEIKEFREKFASMLKD